MNMYEKIMQLLNELNVAFPNALTTPDWSDDVEQHTTWIDVIHENTHVVIECRYTHGFAVSTLESDDTAVVETVREAMDEVRRLFAT